jgi:hypothetical protein
MDMLQLPPTVVLRARNPFIQNCRNCSAALPPGRSAQCRLGQGTARHRIAGLIDLDFEVEMTGFSMAEIDLVLDQAHQASPKAPEALIASGADCSQRRLMTRLGPSEEPSRRFAGGPDVSFTAHRVASRVSIGRFRRRWNVGRVLPHLRMLPNGWGIG